MTPEDVRRLALSLPEAAESAHHGHPDFRVRGKIFASLRPEKGLATVKLAREHQEMVVGAEPAVFAPAAGAWGRQGWTSMSLAAADEATLRSALAAAWREVAPRPIVAAVDGADERRKSSAA